MINALTVDVEDYYNVFSRDWLGRDGPPTDAVVRNTHRLLEILRASGVRATFFILGEVAATFPDLVRRIASAGHEIGVHGYSHRQVFKLTPAEFRRELAEAIGRIEDAAGVHPAGHRAAAFSIRPDTAWGLKVLAEMGFRYDSSVFPFAGRRYGWPGFPQDIHRMDLPGGLSIIEAPLTVTRVLGKAVPACGGGYLRQFPYWFTRWAMRRMQRVRPVIVYAHPYELDTQPPPADFAAALAAGDRAARRHHAGQLRRRATVAAKLARLLAEFRFAPLGEVVEAALCPAAPRPAGGP